MHARGSEAAVRPGRALPLGVRGHGRSVTLSPAWAIGGLLALAAGGAGPATSAPHAVPKLISESRSLVPGERTTLALTFEIDRGWHMYWNGQDGEGMAPELTLKLPEGYTTGDFSWPPPHRLVEPGGVLSHVYEDRLTILIPVQTPKSAKPGDKARFSGSVKWVICGSVCVPEAGEVSLELPVAEKASDKTTDARHIDAARRALPKPISDAAGKVTAKIEEGRLIVEAAGARKIAFYPAAECPMMPALVKEGEAAGGRLSIGVDGEESDVVSGVVMVMHDETPARHYTIELPLRPAPRGPEK